MLLRTEFWLISQKKLRPYYCKSRKNLFTKSKAQFSFEKTKTISQSHRFAKISKFVVVLEIDADILIKIFCLYEKIYYGRKKYQEFVTISIPTFSQQQTINQNKVTFWEADKNSLNFCP